MSDKRRMSDKEAREALNNLVRDGFVKRHPGDRYSLTEKGLKEAERLLAIKARPN